MLYNTQTLIKAARRLTSNNRIDEKGAIDAMKALERQFGIRLNVNSLKDSSRSGDGTSYISLTPIKDKDVGIFAQAVFNVEVIVDMYEQGQEGVLTLDVILEYSQSWNSQRTSMPLGVFSYDIGRKSLKFVK